MSDAMKLTVTLVDGNVYEVNAIFADLIKYDVLRSRNNFPKREDSDFLFMGLVAFCALTRVGSIANNIKLDDFLNTIQAISPVESDTEDEAEFPSNSGD